MTARLQVLEALADGSSTCNEIASRLHLNRATVRKELASLKREGQVRKVGEQGTGGRPAWVYAISEGGTP